MKTESLQLTRRGFFGACGSIVLGRDPARAAALNIASDAIASIEHAHGGRLGVFAFDTFSMQELAWRADETFPMESTFKAPLAALVLERVQEGQDRLDQNLAYGVLDMLPVSPVTQTHLPEGKLSIGKLVAAILEVSDNTAANLLLAHVGGPAALTRYVRRLGDDTSQIRLPEMMSPPPGVENTTTPRAYAKLMKTMLIGSLLRPSSRWQLRAMMADNYNGRARLRASFPRTWAGADRTGTGDGVCNDIAMAWRNGQAPLAIAVFYAAPRMDLAAQEAVLREVGRAVVGEFH